MDTTGLDGVLLSRRCNFSWYTCGAHNYVSNACEVGNSHLLVTRDGAWAICNNIEATRLQDEELAGLPIELCPFDYSSPTEQAQVFAGLIGARRVAADAPAGRLKLPALDSGFDRLRWQLLDVEVDRMRALCNDTVQAVEATCRNIDRCASETSIAGELSCALRSVGAVPWVLLVAADDRIEKFRHPLPTELQCRRLAMLAVGAEREGLISACTRLVSFTKLSADLQARHKAVTIVDAALWSMTRPNVTFGEIFDEAEQAYEQTGYGGQSRLHHQGGSIGYQAREVKAAPNDATVVLENQAFAWNPSITGTKSEDTILCKRSGPLPLASPTDWPVISARWKDFQATRPDILVR